MDRTLNFCEIDFTPGKRYTDESKTEYIVSERGNLIYVYNDNAVKNHIADKAMAVIKFTPCDERAYLKMDQLVQVNFIGANEWINRYYAGTYDPCDEGILIWNKGKTSKTSNPGEVTYALKWRYVIREND